MPQGKKIAMWSGPRNISTALMYSFDNRDDCYSTDEPLYGHFLKSTGTPHPGAEEVIENHETDIEVVISGLIGPNPQSKKIWYQKHMCHHILDHTDLSWLKNLTNCFLIRNPRDVIFSLSRITDSVDLRATGLPQQKIILEYVSELIGKTPPIVDSNDILTNTRPILEKLCETIEIPFSNRMLNWEPGPRLCDGIWAKNWYGSVWKTTGFVPSKIRDVELNSKLTKILAEAMPIYRELRDMRIVA